MTRGFIVGSLLALATSVSFAADLGVKKPSPAAPAPAMCKETKGLPADVFGFSTGSDVSNVGDWALGLDNTYAAGSRGGRGYGYVGTAQISGSFFRCFEIGPYLTYNIAGFKPYGGIERQGTVIAGGVEMKYKLLGRGSHGIGLTLALNPNYGAYSGQTLYGGDSKVFSNSYRVLIDKELIQGKLFGALNLELTQVAYANAQPGFNNVSQINIRAALATPVTDALYLGVDTSYQLAKTGMWGGGAFRASAVYVGPSFFWQINDKFSLNGTWAYQIAGNDKSGPSRLLGTSVLPLHQARLKLGYAF